MPRLSSLCLRAPLLLGLLGHLGGGCATPSSSAVDGGGDAASCTCLTIYAGGGDCNCHEQVWGCLERPQRQVACDIPPTCGTTAIDPETGCERPIVDPHCANSCGVVDPPWPTCDAQRIGLPCTLNAGECGPRMTCLVTGIDQRGVCTCMDCTPDDPLTVFVNEDTCPELSQNVCATVNLSGGNRASFCFRKCEPALGANSCTAPLTCDPRFGSLVGLPAVAICARIGCQTDADCPVFTTRSCQPTAFDGGSCPAGERCRPVSVDGKQGLCARAGVCDKPSGLCAPRQQDLTIGASVGDPCQADGDCDGNQRCERERDLALFAKPADAPCFIDTDCCSAHCKGGKCAAGLCPVHARNGYCVVEGCAFSSLSAYACPEGSSCNLRYPAGLCQRTCDLHDAKSCRGLAEDRLGDYECRDLSALAGNGIPDANGPVCDFGDGLRCRAVLGCADVGLAGNPTQMSCRNLDGRVLADPRSPEGLCLDDTTAGSGVP